MVDNALSRYLALSENERWQYLDWLYSGAQVVQRPRRPIEDKVERFLSLPLKYQKRYIRRFL